MMINKDAFYRPSGTSGQCIVGTEIYPDSGILLNYDNDVSSQGYHQNKEASGALTKDINPKPFISDQDFEHSNEGNDLSYKLYVFDVRCQKDLESAQPIKVEFKFSENIPAGIFGYPLVLTNKLVIISSDGQRHFDLN